MRSSKALFAGLLALCTSAFAERIQPSDLGLSVWVPDGWALASEGGDDEFRLYTLYDTTGAHSALFQLEALPGAQNVGGATQWVKTEALVRGYDIEGSCFGTLLSDDSVEIDGMYAREVYGRAADCDSSSNDLLSDLQDRFFRILATGDMGWVLSFAADTADVDSASATYLTILDSIQVDANFQVLPKVGVRPHLRRLVRHRVAGYGKGMVLEMPNASRPEVQVMDLNGRILSGLVESAGEGRWSWRPAVSHQGMVVVRIRSGSSQWMDRAVLPR